MNYEPLPKKLYKYGELDKLHTRYWIPISIVLELLILRVGYAYKDIPGDSTLVISIVFGWGVALIVGMVLSWICIVIHMSIAQKINSYNHRRAWEKDSVNQFIKGCRK